MGRNQWVSENSSDGLVSSGRFISTHSGREMERRAKLDPDSLLQQKKAARFCKTILNFQQIYLFLPIQVLWKPKKCPVYGREFERLLKSEQVLNFVKNHSKTLNYLTEHSGKEMTDLNDAFRLHQVLDSEVARNLSLPIWTRKVFPKELKLMATQKLVYENGTPLLKRLYIGKLFLCMLRLINSPEF